MTLAPADAEPTEHCANCDHSPAYHDGDGGRPCRAWDPDRPDFKCACKGWEKTPAPVPQPAAAPEPEEMPWK